MPISLDGALSPDMHRILPGLIELAEFGLLLLLGYSLVKLMTLETWLHNNRANLLRRLGHGATELRALRRRLEKTGGNWPTVPLSPALKRLWLLGSWMFRILALMASRRGGVAKPTRS